MAVIPLRSLAKEDMRLLAKLTDGRALELIIFPTEQCNFRCTYCYEDFAIGKMKPETMDAVKELMRRRAVDLDNLYLSWFGGEPLLAKDIVLELSSYAFGLAKERRYLTYRGGMSTNGYLLNPATFFALATVGVLDYQVSLDGPREIHNRTRVTRGGGKSFDTIWKNLLAVRAADFAVQVTLRIHFSPDNLTELEPLINEIKSNFLSDPRFAVSFKAIGRWGGPNDHNIRLLAPEAADNAVRRLKSQLYGDGLVPQEEEPRVCYASRPNSLVIRSDGTLGKCTVALGDSRNMIGKLRPDGTLELNQNRLRPWLRGLGTMDADTLACPLIGLPSEQ